MNNFLNNTTAPRASNGKPNIMNKSMVRNHINKKWCIMRYVTNIVIILHVISTIFTLFAMKNTNASLMIGLVLITSATVMHMLFMGKMWCQMSSKYFWSMVALTLVGIIFVVIGAQQAGKNKV
tara:strand:+ start:1500 stop:1868 length:369 start_codon:yes stop_codon:yes gene_type:complete